MTHRRPNGECQEQQRQRRRHRNGSGESAEAPDRNVRHDLDDGTAGGSGQWYVVHAPGTPCGDEPRRCRLEPPVRPIARHQKSPQPHFPDRRRESIVRWAQALPVPSDGARTHRPRPPLTDDNPSLGPARSPSASRLHGLTQLARCRDREPGGSVGPGLPARIARPLALLPWALHRPSSRQDHQHLARHSGPSLRGRRDASLAQ